MVYVNFTFQDFPGRYHEEPQARSSDSQSKFKLGTFYCEERLLSPELWWWRSSK